MSATWPWLHRIVALLSKERVLKAQHDEIRDAVDELQDTVVAELLNEDGVLDIAKDGNHVRINMNPDALLGFMEGMQDVDVEEAAIGDILVKADERWIKVTPVTKTFLTDVRYDTASHELQKKTYTCKVIEVEDEQETDWAEITGGQAELCPE